MTIHHCVFGSAGSPTNLYFAKQSKTLLGQEECAFAFCSYNNKLEHRTSSLKSSCRRLQFSQQSFPSFLICKVPQLSVLNKPVGLGQSVCVCVCVCVHCFQCEISESYSVLGGYSELPPKPPFRYIYGQLLWFLTMVVKNQIPESFHLCRFTKKHQRIKHVPRFFKYTTTVLNFIEKVKWPLRNPAGSKLALSLRMNQCVLLNTWNLQLFDSDLFKTMEPMVINKIKYLPNTDP